MAYFEDLSDYAYHHSFHKPGTKNIGWLASGHEFRTMTPTEETLSLLWDYCRISVAQSRGIHECEFCPRGKWHHAERNGERLLLGTSEIRVFSLTGSIYAAPTLIYHYISVHQYTPPDEFLHALGELPRPPSEEYLERLSKLGLEWSKTSVPDANAVRFKFIKTESGKIIKTVVE